MDSLRPSAETMDSLRPSAETMDSLRPSAETMDSLRPSAETMTLRPSAETMDSLRPSAETMTLRPSAETMDSLRPSAETMTLRPSAETMDSLRPSAETMTLRPSAETMTLRPSAETMTLRPLAETMTLRPSAGNMDRSAALQVLADDVVSNRTYGPDHDTVALFVQTMLNQNWQVLQERMDRPLTEAHLTQITKKTFEVMSDLMVSVVPIMLSHQQPLEQNRIIHLDKHVRFASPMTCDMEFMDTRAEEVMSIITSSFQRSSKVGAKDKRDAGKVLQALASTISSSTEAPQKEMASDQQSQTGKSESDYEYNPLEEDYAICASIYKRVLMCIHKVKGSNTGSSLMVRPQKVTDQLSDAEFQRTTCDALEKFLQKNYEIACLKPQSHCSETRVRTVASELLDTVRHSANEMCSPKVNSNIKVSQETLHETALDLKEHLNIKIVRFFSHTESAADQPEILSKSKLSLFASLLTENVYSIYCQQAESEQEAQLNPNSRPQTVPEVLPPMNTKIQPTNEAYAFVSGAMTRLVNSLSFPTQKSSDSSSDPSGQIPLMAKQAHPDRGVVNI
ncbi:unnamed protein product [Knipowitschia caucasica]|uniref:Uncharacterized protein n=1 Tax=Knipowitschia caucasica TaxID=637954 RepID=A0AAV2MJM4_KNICA